MSVLKYAAVVSCLSALLIGPSATAATLTHTNLPDFQTGISDGVAQAIVEFSSGTPRSGAIGVVPTPGTVVFNDDFNYTSVAAASASYLFRAMNEAEVPNLVTNPSEFLFSGDTPTTVGGTAPPAGFLRLRASRPADIWDTNNPGGRSPVLALHKTVVDGDFIAETKLVFPSPRSSNNYRHDGLFIGVPSSITGGQADDIILDGTSDFIAAGTFSIGAPDMYATTSRMYGGVPTEFAAGSHPGDTVIVRIVKRGQYFFVYMKNADDAPWVFQQYFKYPALDEAEGLVIGVFAKSFTLATPTYQDDDFDYLKVTRIDDVSGSFTNVFDAGGPANWQRVAMAGTMKQGMKYQLRAGNTLAAGTLTDAGPFVGPDGTEASFFTDEAAQVPPAASEKRYLEYKLFLDEAAKPLASDVVTPNNLPSAVRSVSATYQPGGIGSVIKSTATDFGAVSGGVQIQPGDGDLSLARTELFRDDFNTAYNFGTMQSDGTFDASPNGWYLNAGRTAFEPTVVGDYSMTERPGYFRMKVGFPQDFYGGILTGGVKLLRDLPAGIDPDNFEIETEVNMENQQCRMATLLLWMDENNWVGIGLARRFENWWEVGVIEDMVLNAIGQGPAVANYATNTLQLRVSKRGTWITVAYRDPASASPSWRSLVSRNTAGAATGGADFVPSMVGVMGKSYGKGDHNTQFSDFNYFRVANLATQGQTDIALTLPASTRPDALVAFGDALSAANTKAQVKNAGGTFVGPDGTAATFFTQNEPKLPAGLEGLTDSSIRVILGGAELSGTPYLHAAGVQYATGSTRVARDTNAADFAAGVGQNTSVAVPGIVSNGGGIGPGTPQTESFNYSDNDLATKPWEWSNTPSNHSAFTFTDVPGSARLNLGQPEDLWLTGTAVQKPRAFLYKDQPVSGDYDIEMTINMPNGRDWSRHFGIGVVHVRAEGTAPDTNLDLENVVMYGPYNPDRVRFMNLVGNGFSDWGDLPVIDTYMQLKLEKRGSTFTGYYRATPADVWTQTAPPAVNPNVETAYIGILGKGWGSPDAGQLPIDVEDFTFTPMDTGGAYESRVMDLGATGLAPMVETLGGNSAAAQVQFRAADTAAGLAGLPYLGPDGTTSTYFAGNYVGPLPAAFIGKRYFQYRVLLPVGTQINDLAIVGQESSSLPFTTADVLNALRIAGGIATATVADVTRLDLEKGASAGRVELIDAARVLRAVNGL